MPSTSETRQAFARYQWLDRFWELVVGKESDRRWIVYTLYDGDLALRDALAHGLSRGRLNRRPDVQYRFVRAWQRDRTPAAPGPSTNVLFVGRPKPCAGSPLMPLATLLEDEAVGQFEDPNIGQTGNSIRYGHRVFSRREVGEPPGDFRRCDRDYGILLYRHAELAEGNVTSLVAIAGLGTLGTLGLAVILSDDVLRLRLRRQAERLAPLKRWHRPDQWVELCVRIEVDGHEKLATLLNDIHDPQHRPFRFEVEAVAVPRRTGPAVFVREPTTMELRLEPGQGRVAGGYVRAGDAPKVRLSKKRMEALVLVRNEPDRATPEELCRRLGFTRKNRPVQESDRRNLSKLTHDLNRALLDDVLPEEYRGRPIRFSRKDGVYYLDPKLCPRTEPDDETDG